MKPRRQRKVRGLGLDVRPWNEVNKTNLLRRFKDLRLSGCETPIATVAREFRCDPYMVESYIRSALERLERAKRQPTAEELMAENDRIEVRSKKNPRLVVYCDASRRDNALAMLEAMGG